MRLLFIGLRLLLALRLTIRVIEMGDMAGRKSEWGGGWKKFAKLIMLSLY